MSRDKKKKGKKTMYIPQCKNTLLLKKPSMSHNIFTGGGSCPTNIKDH